MGDIPPASHIGGIGCRDTGRREVFLHTEEILEKGGNLQEHHNGSRIPEPIRNGEPIRAERSRRGSERGKGENLHGSG